MKIHPPQGHAPRRDPPALDRQPADGDNGAQYGYGHRAHKPDPAASYGFRPGPPRVLPKDERRRWRVPG